MTLKNRIKLPMYLKGIQEKTLTLEEIPYEARTLKICMEAINQDSYELTYTPKHLMTPELYMEIIKKDGCALRYVPKEARTPELCMEAVKQNCRAIEYVPEEYKTPEICMETVKGLESIYNIKYDSHPMEFVPDRVLLEHPEICAEAFKRSDCYGVVATEVLEKHTEVIINAIKENPNQTYVKTMLEIMQEIDEESKNSQQKISEKETESKELE